ncbi:MAG: hypothetical protein QXP65_04010 [Candidatus Hadarchaeales archaeon]
MVQRVRILKDVPQVKLVGRQIGPFAAGQEVELEPWEVNVFERHGLAEPVQRLTTAEVRKLLLAEERTAWVGVLPPDFYEMIPQAASSLREEGQLEKLEEFRAAIWSLVELRLEKLLRAAVSSADLGDLPPREKFLVNRLAKVIKDWNEWLNDLFEEKVGGEAGERDEKFGGNIRDVVGNEADIQKQGVPSPDLHAGGTAPP